jgi:F-type H+-transporting ATPase subunit c
MRVLSKISLVFVSMLLVPDVALAAEAGIGWGLGIGAGLAIGLAGLGCGIAQGLTGAGATQGIARNPGAAGQIQTPMIITLALIESISLYGLVIAILLINQL